MTSEAIRCISIDWFEGSSSEEEWLRFWDNKKPEMRIAHLLRRREDDVRPRGPDFFTSRDTLFRILRAQSSGCC